MVRSSVEADTIYDLPVLKGTLLRLFPRIHLKETRGRPGLFPPGGRPFRRSALQASPV